jgi:predicted hotdog family 3-hydroxylacyl-ACP dehydratase
MSAFPPIEELVPHADGMLLIARVVAEEGETVRGEAVVAADGVFFQPGRGMPAYVGFELMAQTISAYDGLRRRRNGKAPAIGFLLGCRAYRAARPFFAAGERLAIEVTSLLGDEGMASFDCRILGEDGAELATGVINVYRPPDPEAFLQAGHDGAQEG